MSLSGHEDEPLKLEWYISPDGAESKWSLRMSSDVCRLPLSLLANFSSGVFYSMSTLPVSTRAETADLPSMLDYSP